MIFLDDSGCPRFCILPFVFCFFTYTSLFCKFNHNYQASLLLPNIPHVSSSLKEFKMLRILGLTIDLHITFADGILLVSQIEPFRVSFSGQLGENNNQRENEKWK